MKIPDSNPNPSYAVESNITNGHNGHANQANESHAVEPATSSKRPIALVCMPWSSLLRPSVAMGVLKGLAQTVGVHADLHFLNVRFAAKLDLTTYEAISSVPDYSSEWFFSRVLFGADVAAGPQAGADGLAFTETMLFYYLRAHDSKPAELCRRIAESVASFIEDCATEIDWSQYMAVGFTTTFAQTISSLLMAKRIKEKHPDVKIIFGGANVESEMGVELMRNFRWIDYAVHGEAENSFPALLNNLASGSQERVPGVTMWAGDELVPGDADAKPVLDLNVSPPADYTEFFAEAERWGLSKKFHPTLYFESSRGCWWGQKYPCTFCGLNGTTMGFRKKHPDRIYAEILALSRKHRILTLAAADNILPPEYFTSVFPRLVEHQFDLDMFFEVKANLHRQQLKMLREAGGTRIQPGIESLSTRVLKIMRKGITAIQNVQFLKWCAEFDLEAHWHILWGFPGENADDYKGLPALMRLISHLRPPQGIGPIQFQRFSAYFTQREKFGVTLKPCEGYKLIFPDSVNLEKVAYYFDGEWEGRLDVDGYTQPVREACNEWSRIHKEQQVFCYYTKGPDYITIYDNRPLTKGSSLKGRKVELSEQLSALYLYCDENHAYPAIKRMLNERFPGEVSESQLQDWLVQLVEEGLMLQEGDRYLSLAIHGAPARCKRCQAESTAAETKDNPKVAVAHAEHATV
jgi:ribosomal peptide maturation radical SAM protein 1